jgi:hypothetical protein
LLPWKKVEIANRLVFTGVFVMCAVVIPDWLATTETVVKILGVLAGGVAFVLLGKVAYARLEYEKLRFERDKADLEVQKLSRDIQKMDLDMKKQAFERDKADLEVQKLSRDIQKMDLDMKKQAVLGITITANQISLPGDAGKFVSAVVEVLNRGTRIVRLGYKDPPEPFAVTLVSFAPGGKPIFGESIRLPVPQAINPNAHVASHFIRPSATEVLPFVCRVESPGLYFVTFRVQVSASERGELEESCTSSGNPISWVAKTYVTVN